MYCKMIINSYGSNRNNGDTKYRHRYRVSADNASIGQIIRQWNGDNMCKGIILITMGTMELS